MDPRNRADETLARARARGAFVVTPDNATSPMDASATARIPRDAIAGNGDAPNPTLQFPGQAPQGQTSRDQAPQGQASQDQTAQGQITQSGGHQGAGQQNGPARGHEFYGQAFPGGESPSGGAEQRTSWPTADQQAAPSSSSQAHPDQSGIPEAPQWPTAEQTEQWAHPTSPFGPLNPETAQRLQW